MVIINKAASCVTAFGTKSSENDCIVFRDSHCFAFIVNFIIVSGQSIFSDDHSSAICGYSDVL